MGADTKALQVSSVDAGPWTGRADCPPTALLGSPCLKLVFFLSKLLSNKRNV